MTALQGEGGFPGILLGLRLFASWCERGTHLRHYRDLRLKQGVCISVLFA